MWLVSAVLVVLLSPRLTVTSSIAGAVSVSGATEHTTERLTIRNVLFRVPSFNVTASPCNNDATSTEDSVTPTPPPSPSDVIVCVIDSDATSSWVSLSARNVKFSALFEPLFSTSNLNSTSSNPELVVAILIFPSASFSLLQPFPWV